MPDFNKREYVFIFYTFLKVSLNLPYRLTDRIFWKLKSTVARKKRTWLATASVGSKWKIRISLETKAVLTLKYSLKVRLALVSYCTPLLGHNNWCKTHLKRCSVSTCWKKWMRLAGVEQRGGGVCLDTLGTLTHLRTFTTCKGRWDY